MARYFINDTEVSRDEAFYAWRFSQTYRQARHNKNVIWDNAHHGQADALNHLREAGVRIEPDSPQEASDA
ncbi:hypothetical protein H7691_12635 [Stenotrophomonas sp. CW117]|uniref:hypothetical protein n=1 Tax=Stenotrophomonas TaxID=40323 RepID=UPI00070242A3|nr:MULTISPECIES: hypothetical protein [Stenotrophomonas]KRG86144.1 hypothetical protein ABB33_04965 [Stenotrophomonas acidaminiphila]QOF97481.1 hypothetical protein H7691_12635 [Stenotrophomonas sp. CW117]